MWRPGLLLAGPALCLVLAASSVAAGDGSPPGPVSPSLEDVVVRAGDLLDVSFRFPDGLEIDEWEAYLSLDGGETWKVRLMDGRGGETTRLVVRVPDLPTSAARVLVRAGGDAGRFERDVAVSGVFRIDGGGAPPGRPRPDGGRLPRRGDFVHIEWVIDEPSIDGGSPVRLPDGLSGGAPAVVAAGGPERGIVLPSTDGRLEGGPGTSEQSPARTRPAQVAGIGAFRRASPPPRRR